MVLLPVIILSEIAWVGLPIPVWNMVVQFLEIRSNPVPTHAVMQTNSPVVPIKLFSKVIQVIVQLCA